jgi:DNA-directed RNA polymerase beta subunit
MDPRYGYAPIFDRRGFEWQIDKIKGQLDELFKKIENIEGWKFISSSMIHSSKISKEELRKSFFQIYRVKIKGPDEKEYDYDIHIPELINNQYFYIGGYMKIPMFQLYDYPVIYRNHMLKLRTNTISLFLDDKEPNYIELFGKSVSLALLLTLCHKKDELMNFIDALLEEKTSEYLKNLKLACETLYSRDEKSRLEELGKTYSSTSDYVRKANNIIFSIKVAYDVDFYNQLFFDTDSITFEVLNALHNGYRSDVDIKHKRIRFSEYVLSPLIKKVYDMLITLKVSNKNKFQIPTSIIMDFCNRNGDVLRSNFAINPVGEIANMMQLTLTGPGGFKKENVPLKLRNIDDSQFGIICPADTPDRAGCGVTQNLVPTVGVDERGNLSKTSDEIVTSYPISLTPFLEHNDQVRLQMASNQAKQAILLKNSQKSWIRSGLEDQFLDKGSFLFRAKSDGYVLHIDDKIMLVVYTEDNDQNKDKVIGSEYFKIGYSNIYQNLVDLITVDQKFMYEGSRFNKGEILCQSHFIKNGELSLGQNLMTGIAIWKGFNYEDGIVLSKSVAEKKFTSIHSVDLSFNLETSQVLLSLSNDKYLPLPKLGQVVKKGESYARIKTLDLEEGFESINMEPMELTAPIDCKIISIEIYPNSWNKQVKEFNAYIDSLIKYQGSKYSTISSKLESIMNKDEADKFMINNDISKMDCEDRRGKYSLKGSKFKGIQFKIHAVYEECIGIGDKIANRHGNKGVIALIEDDEKMPILPDGRRLEVIFNPLGIISRINPGQLFELHLNECLYQVKKKITELFHCPDEALTYYEGFLNIIDKTPDKWVTKKLIDEFKYHYPLASTPNYLLRHIYIIQPPFYSIGPDELDKAMEYTGASYKYPIYDPERNRIIENPISCGYMYVLKLVHRSSDKMSARSIGPYSKKTLQPLGGKSRQGGHRVGEMEVWALMAHGVNKHFLKDLLTVQADSPGLKNELLAKVLNNPVLADCDQTDKSPQSLRLLGSYLKQLGLEMENEVKDESEPDPGKSQ